MDQVLARPLRGIVRLNAHALGASSVVFSVILQETNTRPTIEEVEIGQGRRGMFPNDWTIDWDTSNFPNEEVKICVKIVDGYGRGLAPRSIRTVRIAN
jgi:hypothetical protein